MTTEIEKLNLRIEQLEKENKELKIKLLESVESEKKELIEHNKCKEKCLDLERELKEIKEKAKRAGRKKSLSSEEVEEIKELRSEGVTVRAIAERLNTSMSTVNRVLKNCGGNENMENKKYGWLGYNNNNDRYGILNKMDLWEDDGLHCGECLDIVIDGKIVHTRIEMKGKTWYLFSRYWT